MNLYSKFKVPRPEFVYKKEKNILSENFHLCLEKLSPLDFIQKFE